VQANEGKGREMTEAEFTTAQAHLTTGSIERRIKARNTLRDAYCPARKPSEEQATSSRLARPSRGSMNRAHFARKYGYGA
jgi:hypothetical protein